MSLSKIEEEYPQISSFSKMELEIEPRMTILDALCKAKAVVGREMWPRILGPAWNFIRSTAFGMRSAGISIKNTVLEFVNTLKELACQFIPRSCSSTLDLVCKFMADFIEEKINQLLYCVSGFSVDWKTLIVYLSNLFVIIISLSLPSSSIGYMGKFLMTITSCICIISKSLLATASNTFLFSMLMKLKPSHHVFDIHLQGEEDYRKDFKQDFREWISQAIMVISIISMSIAGLEFPSDKKNLNEFLQRSAVLGRAMQTWSVVSDKIVDFFDQSYKMIFKHYYGNAYCSTKIIPAVESLYKRTMDLCRLSEAIKIQSDPDKMDEIQSMYLEYLEYLKIYGSDAVIKSQLVTLGKVLTHFYQQVSAKNPKSYVMRQEPVCVVFYGSPGVGKSYLMTPLQQDLCKIAGVINDKNDFTGKIYSRCVEHEFWDGYSGQPIVLYDDYGQMKDSISNPNLEFYEIIRTVNMFPYQLHSAALETKANNAFRAHFVILTTNLEKFDPVSIIEPEALTRRMHLTYKVTIIDEVKGEHGVDDSKLAVYRIKNDLPESDMSHYRFIHDTTKQEMTYDQIIVEISKKYQKHKEGYEVRQRLAKEKESVKLPPGAYSADPRWIAQDSFPRLPLPIFIQLPEQMRQQLLDQGVEVYSNEFFFDPTEFLLNSVEQLKRAIEADPTCCRYTAQGTRIENGVLQALHHQLSATPEFDILTTSQRIEQPIMKKYFIKLWQSLEAFKNIVQQRYGKYIRALAFISGTIVAISGLARLKSFLTSFQTDSLKGKKKCEMIGFLCMMDLKMAGVYLICKQAFGYVNLAAALLNYYNHYKKHMDYEKGCSECRHHITLHNAIMEDSKIKVSPEINNIEEQVSYLKMLVEGQDVNEVEKQALKEPTDDDEDKQEIECESVPKIVSESPSKDQMPQRNRTKYEDAIVSKIVSESPSKDQMPQRNRTKYENTIVPRIVSESPSKDQMPQRNRTRYENAIIPKQPFEGVCPSIRHLFPESISRNGTKPEGVLSENVVQVNTLVRNWIYDIRLFFTRNGVSLSKRVGLTTVIKGHVALINYHFIQICGQYYQEFGNNLTMMLCIPEQEEGHEFSIEHLQTAKPIYRGEVKTEFYVWKVPESMPMGKDLTHHFIHPKSIDKLHTGVRLQVVTYEKEKDHLRRITREGDFIDISTVELEDIIDPSITHYYPKSARYAISTQPGDCGAPVIINSTSFSKNILGFHFGGSPGQGTCSIITYKDIEPFIKKEKCSAPLNSLNISENHKVDPQADFVLPLSGSFQQVGKITRPVMQPMKTALKPSLIHGFYGPSQVAPAVLKPALTENGPMLKGLSKNKASVRLVSENILDLAVHSYLEKMNSSPSEEIERRVLTFEEACMGIPGETYFPPMKRSKSAGWPWMFEATKGKTDWLGDTDWNFRSPESLFLRDIVNQMEDQCRRGQVPEVYFVDTLKDEKRPLEKVQAEKTRCFSAAPMHFSILFRKYFLGFIAYISRTRYYNECCVGTNVYSKDWRTLAEQLLRFGDGGFTDGDFENYDGTINFYIFNKILFIANRFYSDSPQNQLVRKMLWEALTRASHILYDIVYLVSHGQPSGNPATAPFNSLYVSLSIRYCIGMIDTRYLIDFNKTFALVTYGDDFILSVQKGARDEINGRTLSEQFKKIGMRLTNANKQDHDGTFLKLSDVKFLKRGFSYDPKLQWWFAPLELQSIIELCNWIKKSPSDLSATIANVNAAQYELFHHPEEVYNEFLERLQQVYPQRTHHMLTWKPWRLGRSMVVTGEIMEFCDSLLCI